MERDESIVAAEVTERMRSDILFGTLRPGEWLRQIDLQDRYDCTRSAVRAALAMLVAGQVVEHVLNRGFRVVQQSVEIRAEITEVRLMLELPAAEMIVDAASARDVAVIRDAAQAFDASVEFLPYQEIRRLNHAFHRSMIAPIRNATLVNQINELRERDLPGDWSAWTITANVRRSSADHLAMVEAIETRDPTLLRELIRNHLTAWKTDKRTGGAT